MLSASTFFYFSLIFYKFLLQWYENERSQPDAFVSLSNSKLGIFYICRTFGACERLAIIITLRLRWFSELKNSQPQIAHTYD